MSQVATKCPSCKKTIIAPTRASMTAWLFRAAQCSCETAKLKVVEAAAEAESVPLLPAVNALVGTTVDDRYQLMSVLGEGGMGFVYRALDQRTGTQCALKMLAPHLADRITMVKRLQQEAKAMQALDHPNIVPIHAVGSVASGSPYLTMDYIEGQSLEDVLRATVTLPYERALNIFIQTAQALAHAHSKGIVHRDLKPSNILLCKSADGSEKVKLVDFGIARIADEYRSDKTKLTQTGELVGSPMYMSPEQCRGFELDGRSDIYSFGCVMYEVLSGQPPFDGDNAMQILFNHLSEEPAALARDLDPGLTQATMRCLEKEAGDRYQSAEALLQDLERSASGKRPLARIVPWSRRKLRKAMALALIPASMLAMVAMVALGASTGLFQPPNQNAAVPEALVLEPLSAFTNAFKDGSELYDMEDYAGASKKFQEALLHASAVGEENQQYQSCIERLAVCLRKLGNSERAVELDLQLARIKRFTPPLGTIDGNNQEISRLSLESGADKAVTAHLAQTLINQAELYYLQGRFDLSDQIAAAAYKKSVQAGPGSELVKGKALSIMVASDTSLGRYVQAQGKLSELLAIASAGAKANPQLLAETYMRAGRLHYLVVCNGKGSQTSFDHANKVSSKAQFDLLHLHVPDPKMKGQLDTAAVELKRSIALYREIFAGPSSQEARVQSHLAICLMRGNQLSQAADAFERARIATLETSGVDSQLFAEILYHFGELNFCRSIDPSTDQKQKTVLLLAANQYLKGAEKIFERRESDTESSIYLGETLNLQGLVNANLGDFAAAERSYKAGLKIASRWNSYNSTAAEAYERLIALYQSANMPEDQRKSKIADAMILVQSIKEPATSQSNQEKQ